MITLNIYQKYLDQIKSGEKQYEYRKNSPFYEKLLNCKENDILILKSKSESLKCKIISIELVKNPMPEKPVFLNTDLVYQIKILKVD